MIIETTDPWQPGQWGRYEACSRHAGMLARLGDFDRELDIAEACADCRVEYKITKAVR